MTQTTAAPVLPTVPTALTPLGIDSVTITDGFWGQRQALNGDTMIPHCLHWETQAGWLNNFDALLAGRVAKERQGREFADSDVYKLLEAMAWEIGRTGDESLQATLDDVVARIAACQQPDGYLNTRFDNPGQDERYTDFEWGHELYNVGHLVQAAVARLRTGFGMEDPLVRVALRAADHVCRTFGADGLQRVCGHPEIEVALVELYRATGEERYLEQARLFIERRGHGTLADIEFGRSYFQDDVPVRDAEVLRGHAVRALYLAAAAVDVGVEEGDTDLVDAVEQQYARTLARRTYITGGMGSHHQDEAFGEDYELPPDRAYCETCAGIASVMVAWRLLLAKGDLGYADVIERSLYNVVATSPAEDGKGFFYTNTLHRREAGTPLPQDRIHPRASGSGRAAWFEVSCCPTNVSRTFAQLASYVATRTEDGLQLLQFVPGTVSTELPGGRSVTIRVSTEYPHDGRVRIEVLDAPADAWELTVRVPGWASEATVDLGDGEGPRPAQAPAFVHRGVMAAGTVIEVVIAMESRWTYPDPRVDAVRGCVAVERGPLVMCAESVDQPGGADVATLQVDTTAPLRVEDGTVVVTGWTVEMPENAGSAYSAAPAKLERHGQDVRLTPYHRWGNRGPSTMRIWLPIAQGD
ncbi:glycoside hydrolase family 127 protein [Georgenia sp. TF02-10]|uniref:glycoside hydrolase family 127 protein n=1 Tax=Georgenia sp. TF02-10 TaxID=2917725 RepID=UPI001FA7AD53|nr:beta-L-arabinofuranosidase domain-containing protein [Georgenia sp. TF02-10]UNX54455.1 glycoside hydrolase family 127 protein [Georgenia sp. TF02-10]